MSEVHNLKATYSMPTLRSLLLSVTALLPLSVCAGSPAGRQVDSSKPTAISVSGAFALFPMMTVVAEAYEQVNHRVTFDVQADGAGKGMTDMLSGEASTRAVVGREVAGRL